ncbi:hypothetical protein [Methanolobus vulcani]|uniref:Uncharacterized protein n=1 Tax=Methanolobus vulcani TaxID=38026 RepID=A0A7Z8KQK3_9EURY|nr:hypothetical protein [Methanolobus vulcani]TQD28268.1 hypothetical protein FKV42_00935 [Methanolobus vulcani]
MSTLYVDFLESYPLYRKYKAEPSNVFSEFKDTALYIRCKECKSEQVFVHYESTYGKEVHDLLNRPYIKGHVPGEVYISEAEHYRKTWEEMDGSVLHLDFLCKGCGKYHQYVSIKIVDNFTSLIKIGQYPPYDISVPKDVSKTLGESNTELYQKGLICESQSYGIAAYSYYRRILELIIDQLLDDIYHIIPENDENKEAYEKALSETRHQPVAKDKIKLVKDILPPSLNVEGTNPMDILYQALSVGLHSSSDEDCIDIAYLIRMPLIHMITEVVHNQEAKKEFTDHIKVLLKKVSKKNQKP